MLRVDFDSPITEKDKDSGYFLFTYADAGKQIPGSVEVIKVMENGNESVRVVVQLPALPTYVEQMMLDRLNRKLGQEYGQPPQKPAAGSQPAQQQGNATGGNGAPVQNGGDTQPSQAHDAAESKNSGDKSNGDAAQNK